MKDDFSPLVSPTDAPRVLVVEPERAYQAVVARRIAEAGYRVIAVDSVDSAIVELYRMPIDIIVAETKGRQYSGLDLVRFVRGNATLRDLPILMVAGKSDRTAQVDALRAGADATVRKPYDFDVLNARIAREIERARIVGDLRRTNRMLDERITQRAIAVGELKYSLEQSERERARLGAMLPPKGRE